MSTDQTPELTDTESFLVALDSCFRKTTGSDTPTLSDVGLEAKLSRRMATIICEELTSGGLIVRDGPKIRLTAQGRSLIERRNLAGQANSSTINFNAPVSGSAIGTNTNFSIHNSGTGQGLIDEAIKAIRALDLSAVDEATVEEIEADLRTLERQRANPDEPEPGFKRSVKSLMVNVGASAAGSGVVEGIRSILQQLV